jgi:hypothetical protein
MRTSHAAAESSSHALVFRVTVHTCIACAVYNTGQNYACETVGTTHPLNFNLQELLLDMLTALYAVDCAVQYPCPLAHPL